MTDLSGVPALILSDASVVFDYLLAGAAWFIGLGVAVVVAFWVKGQVGGGQGVVGGVLTGGGSAEPGGGFGRVPLLGKGVGAGKAAIARNRRPGVSFAGFDKAHNGELIGGQSGVKESALGLAVAHDEWLRDEQHLKHAVVRHRPDIADSRPLTGDASEYT